MGDFTDDWKHVEPGGEQLPGRADMDRLNAIRVQLKHRGLMPGTSSVDQCADVRKLLEQAVAAGVRIARTRLFRAGL